MREQFRQMREEFVQIPTNISVEEKWKLFCNRYDNIVADNTPTVKKRKIFPVPLEEEIRLKITEKDQMSRKLIEL